MAAKSGGRLISTNEQFEREVLRIGAPPVLVLFTAPWCGPCRLMDPVVREVAGRYRGKIDAVHLSTDDLPEVAADAGVQSVPTILVYNGGEIVETVVGCVATNVLAQSIERVLRDLGEQGEKGPDVGADGGTALVS